MESLWSIGMSFRMRPQKRNRKAALPCLGKFFQSTNNGELSCPAFLKRPLPNATSYLSALMAFSVPVSSMPSQRIPNGASPQPRVVPCRRTGRRPSVNRPRELASRGKTMLKKLEGKTAVITGGTEGIGLAAAKLFVKEGAYVFITGRRRKELDEAVEAIGGNVSGVQGDVAKLADLDRLYETVSKVKGRIDIVFANAGVAEFVPFGAITEEHFDKLFNINVRGTLFTVQKALPLLNDGGSIILNGSVASVKGTAAFDVYAPTMAAIRSFV